MAIKEIESIIEACRQITSAGTLWNPKPVTIPNLVIDIRPSNFSFLGRGNIAIFVNSDTYRLSERYRAAEENSSAVEWKENETIVISSSVVEKGISSFDLHALGVIIHETGHAYNVAAKITNNEGNAYLFEIEVLMNLYKNNHPLVDSFQKNDFKEYFSKRLNDYRKGFKTASLPEMVAKLEEEFKIGDLLEVPKIQTDNFANTGHGLFHKSDNNGNEQTLDKSKSSPIPPPPPIKGKGY